MESNDFRDLIVNVPSQIELGINATKNIKFCKKPSRIIVCGMGGSAIAGEFLKTVFNDLKNDSQLELHKDYNLPLTADKKSIIVCTSYSGNTEETISAYKKAVSGGFETISISSGGILEKLAQKNKTPFVKIDLGSIPPRLSVLFMFSVLVKIMVNSKILSAGVESQLRLSAKGLELEKIEKIASDMAISIDGKTPLIYSSERMNPWAYFLKISFNENSKIHAFCNVLPECQHNEIQGFGDESLGDRFYAVFIKDGKDNARIGKRIQVMSEMIKKRNFDFSVVDFDEFKLKNIFNKIVFVMLMGGLSSLRIAEMKGRDPSSTPLINELKNALTL